MAVHRSNRREARAKGENIAAAIVARFGGVRPLARALSTARGRRVAPTTVQGWLVRGHVPAARQAEVLAAARRHGVSLAPEDFFAAIDDAPNSRSVAAGDETAPLCELLTNAQMADADRLTIVGGTSGERLMEAAGAGVVRDITEHFPRGPVTVLCGPGNNGGDGFVIARHLRRLGWPARLGLLGAASKLKDDAGLNARRWSRAAGRGAIEPLTTGLIDGATLIVDALFGAGLARPLAGTPREVTAAVNASGLPVVAVDVPSGIDGDTGAIKGGDDSIAIQATRTVTFFRLKPGHLLYPGRARCGPVTVVDIGIGAEVLDTVKPSAFRNGPALWGGLFPWPEATGHKYTRGHAVVLGGDEMTGAARLAARACLRIGAGLVTIAAVPDAVPAYARETAAILTTPLEARDDLAKYLADGRRRAVLIGPGYGVGRRTREHGQTALALGKQVCLDADALTSFADWSPGLFVALSRGTQAGGGAVLTPHDGEFARVFPDLKAGDRLARARAGAKRAGAVVLLKGADTVIAAPDGRAVINDNAPPWLATGGAGDVLAGLITGLLAQKVPPFEAAAMAAWIHGAAGNSFGPGLIADDLPGRIPTVLRGLAASHV